MGYYLPIRVRKIRYAARRCWKGIQSYSAMRLSHLWGEAEEGPSREEEEEAEEAERISICCCKCCWIC